MRGDLLRCLVDFNLRSVPIDRGFSSGDPVHRGDLLLVLEDSREEVLALTHRGAVGYVLKDEALTEPAGPRWTAPP